MPINRHQGPARALRGWETSAATSINILQDTTFPTIATGWRIEPEVREQRRDKQLLDPI